MCLFNKYLKSITTTLYKWSGSPATAFDRMRTQEYTAVIGITDHSVTFLPEVVPPMKRHSCCPPCNFEACPWIWTAPQIYHSSSIWANEKHLLIWTDALNLQLCLFATPKVFNSQIFQTWTTKNFRFPLKMQCLFVKQPVDKVFGFDTVVRSIRTRLKGQHGFS